MKNIIHTLTILVLFSFNCASQTNLDNIKFKQFSTSEGLPNNMVHQVYQDKDGFIWIATYYGLFRYDGYEVKTFKSNLYTPGLLINNNVLCVREDNYHRLWIGTHEGLCIYDKRHGTMQKIKLSGISHQRLNDIFITKGNRIYLGYIRGLAYYDQKSNKLVLLSHKNSKGAVPSEVNIQSITEDNKGDLIIGAWKGGVYRYSPKKNLFTHYEDRKNQSFVKLYSDSHGRIWAGTWGFGLMQCLFSENDEKIIYKQYKNNETNNESISSDYILSIAEDKINKSLWFGTREGVSIMTADNSSSFINYTGNNQKNHFSYPEITSIISDKNGLMWLGSQGGGVLQASTHSSEFNIIRFRKTQKFSSDNVSSIYVENNGALWCGVGYGIGYCKDNSIEIVTSQKMPYCIKYRKYTDEMLLTVQDMGIYSARNGKIIHNYTTKNCDFIPHSLVFDIHEDKNDNLWLGTYHGLSVKYKDGKSVCCFDNKDIDRLLWNEITSITEDKNGSLWLTTTNNGIIHLTGNLNNPNSWNCKNYCIENRLLPVNTPLCIFQDKNNRIWAGTEGSGLCLLNKEKDCFESVHLMYNLPGDMVGSIQQDKYGNLWLGTNQGLARLVLSGKEAGSVRVFTVADGLPDNFFNIRSSFEKDGKLYFGCSKGIVKFDPHSIIRNGYGMSLRITDIHIDGKSIKEFSKKELKNILSYTPDFTNKFILPSKYNNFSIHFASLTYNMPQQNKYAYKLVGYDKKWVNVNADNRMAYYSNISPGKYLFELKGTNENGEWSPVRKIQIIVSPPFWMSWGAILLYVILLFSILYIMYITSRRRLNLKNQLKLKEIENTKVQELNHIKLQFFTNITHELMTPLTIISASLDEIKLTAPNLKSLVNTMDSNVQRLIRLLQQILEFRKAESGNLVLRVSKGNIAEFISNEAESFKPLIRHHNLHFSVVCEENEMIAYFDRDKLDKIIYNLLSNAAKYSNENGFIQLNIDYINDRKAVEISVKDNGKGISSERQKTLFKRFYEGDYRQCHTIGTGIGLSLLHDLVSLHKGNIKVKSEEGKGSEFIVSLPIEKDAYTPEEIIEINDEINKDILNDDDTFENVQTIDPNINQDKDDDDKKSESILLVEDNEELLEVMKHLLKHDYRILTAKNGKEALNIAENEDINLIVSDIVMPEMNGIELTHSIKSNIDICHIPIILLTAKNAEEDRNEGYTAGADAYLTKPFHLSVLDARIKNLLKIKERTANDFKKQLAIEIKDLDYTDMDEKFLKDAITCVNKHLSDPDFDVPQFTIEMATSRTTLYKKLRSLTGLNTTGFVRNIRLKAACKFMEENKNIRISDLAYSVGFNDPKYFSICFKKEFGMQPSEYCEKFLEYNSSEKNNAITN